MRECAWVVKVSTEHTPINTYFDAIHVPRRRLKEAANHFCSLTSKCNVKEDDRIDRIDSLAIAVSHAG